LNQENKVATDTFQENGLDLPVAEFLYVDLAYFATIAFTDFFGKLLRASAGENFGRRIHGKKCAAKIWLCRENGKRDRWTARKNSPNQPGAKRENRSYKNEINISRGSCVVSLAATPCKCSCHNENFPIAENKYLLNLILWKR
jgi:hypothetical protein